MLDTNLKTQLKAYLEKVTQPFEIVASLDDGEKSRELLSRKSLSRSRRSTATTASKPTSRCPARTARTWFRR